VYALCELVRDLIPTRGLLAELAPCHVKYPIIVETDSQSAIALIRNGNHARSRHYGRYVNFVNDELTRGTIELRFTPGTLLRADMLTKTIPGSQLKEICKTEFALY
jgi:hypothetical protein